MAKKFITSREIAFIDRINKELIQSTVEQEILYYAISAEETTVDDTYDESISKQYFNPVKINAIVDFDQISTRSKSGILDSNYSIDIKLHVSECIDRNIKPQEGAFVEFGQNVFEITSVSLSQPIFGQINDKLKYQLTLVPSREGLFKINNITPDGIDNSHPVNRKKTKSLGDDL